MITLDDKQSADVTWAITAANIDGDDALRRDYPGGPMFRDECFGIVCDVREYGRFLMALAGEDMELAKELAGDVSTDSMGLGTIYYWSNYCLT